VPARQQFIQQHAERVDVAARINIQSAQARLFRTHIGGGANELIKRRKKRFVRQRRSCRRLGNPKVNDLGNHFSVLFRDENVRRLEVAMDDSFLVRVLDGLTNLNKEIETLTRCAILF